MVESVTWLLHASAELARMFASGFYQNVRDYEICMKNGTRRELLPLIRLRGIGRVRARRLFNNGLTTPEIILAKGIEPVKMILGQGVAEQIFDQLQRKNGTASVPDGGKNSSSGQSTFSNFRVI
jgi:helicase